MICFATSWILINLASNLTILILITHKVVRRVNKTQQLRVGENFNQTIWRLTIIVTGITRNTAFSRDMRIVHETQKISNFEIIHIQKEHNNDNDQEQR